MINIVEKNECCGCHACVNICPKNCISMIKDEEGFLYPRVDKAHCINCGLCDKVCPFNKIEQKRVSVPISYAVKIKNNEIRKKSSSGGFFSELASLFLLDNGVVYGAAFSKDKKSVHHIRVDCFDKLELLRTSKYIQSEISYIYKQVLTDLSNEKKVLFSGVPCQINGLKLFLGKEYDKLVCVEVVCHGVPSPLLWEKYLDYLTSKYKDEIQEVNFRNKKHGWNEFELLIRGNNINLCESLNDNSFMKMFLRNLCLRPSCYNCNVKRIESMSDFTIADFWGIKNVVPGFDDNLGTSLVLLQTQKGISIFDKIKDKTVYCEVDFKSGIKYNTSYFSSVNLPPQRVSFFKDMNTLNFKQLEKKYTNDSLFDKCKRLIRKSIVGRIYIKIKAHKK